MENLQLEKRALFNLLRMNWEIDPSLPIEGWQVEDYRGLPTHALFHRCHQLGISLDKRSFINFAEKVETPEELTLVFLNELNQEDDQLEDKLYLPIFELWRRLLPEKQPLSVFCDELDYQIHQFDHGKVKTIENLQDILANLLLVLEENAEEGNDPKEIFAYISSNAANDVESFLYDFISDLIDNDNLSYASELVEGFHPYSTDQKWFDFLLLRLLSIQEPEKAQKELENLLKRAKKEEDLEFHLELLSFMARNAEEKLFLQHAKNTVQSLETEGDFQDLLWICSDFFLSLDKEKKEKELENLLKKRKSHSFQDSLDLESEDVKTFLQILRS